MEEEEGERSKKGKDHWEKNYKGSRGQAQVLAFHRRKNTLSGVEAEGIKISMNVDKFLSVGTPRASAVSVK